MTLRLAFSIKNIDPDYADEENMNVLGLQDALLNGVMERLVVHHLLKYVPQNRTYLILTYLQTISFDTWTIWRSEWSVNNVLNNTDGHFRNWRKKIYTSEV